MKKTFVGLLAALLLTSPSWAQVLSVTSTTAQPGGATQQNWLVVNPNLNVSPYINPHFNSTVSPNVSPSLSTLNGNTVGSGNRTGLLNNALTGNQAANARNNALGNGQQLGNGLSLPTGNGNALPILNQPSGSVIRR